jgi:peptide/nickel transport system ATP-binding protein
MSSKILLSVHGLSIKTSITNPVLFDPVSFSISAGESVAVTGLSGAGKSLTVLSLLGLEPPGIIVGGQVRWIGLDTDKAQRQELAGSDIGLVLQNPVTALNPLLSVGAQLLEAVQSTRKLRASEATEIVIRLMEEVRLDSPENIYHRYPFQLSGGQCQRIMIALALAGSPKLLIADEPTTSLDVSVQREIMSMLTAVKKNRKMAILLVSHDKQLVNDFADKKVLITKSKIYSERGIGLKKEQQPARKVLSNNYNVLEVSDLCASYNKRPVLDEISFSVRSGEFKVIVGNSGCGKTTIARLVCGFKDVDSGIIKINGNKMDRKDSGASSAQLIFQNPLDSLDPRQTVRNSLMEVINKFNGQDLNQIIESVGLLARLLDMKPHTLSGGECQRVAIGRALAASPALIIADEPTSSMDFVQSQKILQLLHSLCKNFGLATVLITHNLFEAMSYADSILVIDRGMIVEEMCPSDISEHSFTQNLLSAVADPAGIRL